MSSELDLPWLTALSAGDERPVYVQIAAVLREAIFGGHLAVGDQLPSTSQLEAHYGVAAMTIRQAIRKLEAEGYVEPVHGRGVFVLPYLEKREIGLIPSAVQAREVAAQLTGLNRSDVVNRALQVYAAILTATAELGGDPASDEAEVRVAVPARSKRKFMVMHLAG